MSKQFTYQNEILDVKISQQGQHTEVTHENTCHAFEHHAFNGLHTLQLNNTNFRIYRVLQKGAQHLLSINGKLISIDVSDLKQWQGHQQQHAASSGTITAAMPGRVTNIHVQQGDNVDLGTPLLTLEAMKMENEIQAPVAGRIQSIAAEPGASVEAGEILLSIESSDHEA